MNVRDYKAEIDAQDRARDLHEINAEIMEDETLTSDEKTDLGNAIKDKFCRLNRRTEPAKPRWG